jgi:DNA-binding transcriptional LysR family regulator
MGALRDSSLVARRLAASRLVAVASPDYLSAHGSPAHPSELGDHTCILDTNGAARWSFTGPAPGRTGGGDATTTIGFTPTPRLAVNSPAVTRDRLLAGAGISVTPRFVVDADLRAGRLVEVLPRYVMDEIPLHAVYPPGRRLSSRVRAFVDFLVERFAHWVG